MKRNCFKKTNLKRYIALILVFALMFQTGIKYTNANESQETQVHTAYKVGICIIWRYLSGLMVRMSI